MKTLLKVLGALVAVVVVLIVAAVVVVPMFVDPNDYKDEMIARVKEHTGRDLRVEGDLALSVFPWLGVDMGRVELGNAKGFDAPFFARTERIGIRVKLMPLLDRRLEMDTVTVHGLALNLQKDGAGHTNWADLVPAPSPGGAPAAEPSGGGDFSLAALAVGGVDVQDASLTWSDAAAGQRVALQRLSVKTGPVSLGAPVDLDIGFDVASDAPALSGRVTAAARLEVEGGGKLLRASGLTVTADLSGDGLPGGKLAAEIGGDVTAHPADQSVDVANFRVKALGVEAGGTLGVVAAGKGKLAGTLSVSPFSPRAVLEALGQTPPETADPKVLQSAALDATLSGTFSSLALDPLSVKLDESTLSGALRVADIARQALRFDLSLDAIDADRYLPPPAEGAPPAASPGAAAGAAGQLPVETLRRLDVAGRLRAGRVKVSKLTVTEVDATLKAEGGLIRLNPVSAKLYQGAYAGNVTLDARGDRPRVALDEKLSGVQAGPLLADLTGDDRLSGAANVAAKLGAVGATPDEMKKTLGGDVRLRFADGAIKGFNLAQMIRDAKAKLSGGGGGASSAPPRTDFSEITATVKVRDGLATNQDLSAKTPLLRITGKGQASLPAETVDYRVTAKVVAAPKGQGGADLESLSGVPIPVKITGTFAEPSYGVDFEALAGSLAKSKAADLVNKQKAAVGAKVQEQIKKKAGGLGGALKGLLGQ